MYYYQLHLPAALGEPIEWIFDAVEDASGNPVDIASASIVFDISKLGSEPCITASTGNGKITIIEGAAFRVVIPHDEVSRLSAGEYDVRSKFENAGYAESMIVGTLAIPDEMAVA